jgi:flagellar motility protein MotE (MotC chaperone)
MKIKFFSPILVILMTVLSAKLWTLFNKIEAHAGYTTDTAATSILVDNAYATDKKTNDTETQQVYDNYLDQKPDNTPQKNEPPKVENANQETNNKPGSKTGNKSGNKPPPTPQPSQPVGTSLLETPNISNAELKLLKELSKRRVELDKNQEELKVREQVLRATENKIDQKMLELKDLQAKLEEVMKQYDQKELGRIMSLVKIYENMKPRDAAKIFNELEMPVLLQVVSNMKEIKVSPVLASMDPMKARDLSIELAKQKTITVGN